MWSIYTCCVLRDIQTRNENGKEMKIKYILFYSTIRSVIYCWIRLYSSTLSLAQHFGPIPIGSMKLTIMIYLWMLQLIIKTLAEKSTRRMKRDNNWFKCYEMQKWTCLKHFSSCQRRLNMNNNDEIISIFLNVSMCFAKTLLHRCEPIIDNTAIGIHNSVHPGAINLYIK